MALKGVALRCEQPQHLVARPHSGHGHRVAARRPPQLAGRRAAARVPSLKPGTAVGCQLRVTGPRNATGGGTLTSRAGGPTGPQEPGASWRRHNEGLVGLAYGLRIRFGTNSPGPTRPAMLRQVAVNAHTHLQYARAASTGPRRARMHLGQAAILETSFGHDPELMGSIRASFGHHWEITGGTYVCNHTFPLNE